MTNAELYIGDEDLIDQFIDEFNKFACKQDWDLEHHYLKERLVEFFKQERTPTLTEDERVILRNINKDYKYIGRKKFLGQGYMYVSQKEIGDYFTPLIPLEHLFQFIKERRRILYWGTIERRIKMKKAICVLLVLIGLILPFYLLISGIIETVNGINPFDAGAIIIGVIKIFFCAVGFIPAYIGVTIYSLSDD